MIRSEIPLSLPFLPSLPAPPAGEGRKAPRPGFTCAGGGGGGGGVDYQSVITEAQLWTGLRGQSLKMLRGYESGETRRARKHRRKATDGEDLFFFLGGGGRRRGDKTSL